MVNEKFHEFNARLASFAYRCNKNATPCLNSELIDKKIYPKHHSLQLKKPFLFMVASQSFSACVELWWRVSKDQGWKGARWLLMGWAEYL